MGDLDKAAKATLDEARNEGRRTICVAGLRPRTGSWPRRYRPGRGRPARPPPAPSPREAPEAYDDDFAFDEGVAESRPRLSAPGTEPGRRQLRRVLRAERAAARAWARRAAGAGDALCPRGLPDPSRGLPDGGRAPRHRGDVAAMLGTWMSWAWVAAPQRLGQFVLEELLARLWQWSTAGPRPGAGTSFLWVVQWSERHDRHPQCICTSPGGPW